MNKLRRIKIHGSAIVISVLAMSALLTIALGVSQLIPRDYRASLALDASINAEYAAWAGIEHGLLLLRQNRFYELSVSHPPNSSSFAGRPYGQYINPPNALENCDINRNAAICRGLDRQLGAPVNQEPYTFGKTLGGSGNVYELVVWHRRQNVGNVTPISGLDDGLTDEINKFPNSANINPVLLRDELRRLDISEVSSFLVRWKPIERRGAGCESNNPLTEIGLLYTIFKPDGSVLAREYKKYIPGSTEMLQSIPTSGGAVMSFRLIVKNNDPNPAVAENSIKDCFIRYSLQNTQANETADLGFDVIDSTGVSGKVRRKIRVIVNRENGRLLNIFDFGLATESCQGTCQN